MRLIDEPEIAAFRAALIKWYRRTRRPLPWRDGVDPYHIWVSEVMLQQTQVTTVLPYYQRFLEHFPTLEALAAAPQQVVLKCWEGLGYYARARNFHKAAQIVVEQLKGRIPDQYADFRKLPGVGDYIAAAVQSIAFDRPCAVVDGNVKRVLARLLELEAPVNDAAALKIYQQTAGRLLDAGLPGDYNQAIMELGALVCRPQQPQCKACPVRHHCGAFSSGRQQELPRRTPRKEIPRHHLAVGVVRREERILITRRPENGLLGGLWEFPGGKIHPGESPADACRRNIQETVKLQVEVGRLITRVRHAFTHFKITVEVFQCDYRSGELALTGPAEARWVTREALESYPFPKVNHKIFPLI